MLARLWQLSGHVIRIENGLVLLLLVLAAVLAVPALRTLRLSQAQFAVQDITPHVRAVMARAQAERHPFVITFVPRSGRITVARLTSRQVDAEPRKTPVAALSWTLPDKVLVGELNPGAFSLLISAKGEILSRGRVQCHGGDGSRAAWDTETNL